MREAPLVRVTMGCGARRCGATASTMYRYSGSLSIDGRHAHGLQGALAQASAVAVADVVLRLACWARPITNAQVVDWSLARYVSCREVVFRGPSRPFFWKAFARFGPLLIAIDRLLMSLMSGSTLCPPTLLPPRTPFHTE